MFLSNAPDQSINLHTVHLVQLLDGVLDLPLVCLDIDNENQGVVLLNLLHSRLGVKRVDDDLVLIQPGGMWDRLAWVFWCTGKCLGLWSVEGR